MHLFDNTNRKRHMSARASIENDAKGCAESSRNVTVGFRVNCALRAHIASALVLDHTGLTELSPALRRSASGAFQVQTQCSALTLQDETPDGQPLVRWKYTDLSCAIDENDYFT